MKGFPEQIADTWTVLHAHSKEVESLHIGYKVEKSLEIADKIITKSQTLNELLWEKAELVQQHVERAENEIKGIEHQADVDKIKYLMMTLTHRMDHYTYGFRDYRCLATSLLLEVNTDMLKILESEIIMNDE